MDGLMDCRPTVVFLGGEVLKHLIAHLLDCTIHATSSGVVSENLSTETVMWPMWLQCAHIIRKIWGVVVEGFDDSDMQQFFDVVTMFQPDIIVIDILQDELLKLNPDDSVDAICQLTEDLVNYVLDAFPIKSVGVLSPISGSSPTCPEAVMVTKIMEVNKILHEKLDPMDGVYYHVFPQFVQGEDEAPAPLATFSEDLTLPGPSFDAPGFVSYKQDMTEFLRMIGVATYVWLFHLDGSAADSSSEESEDELLSDSDYVSEGETIN